MDKLVMEIPQELTRVPSNDPGWGAKVVKELQKMQRSIQRKQDDIERMEKQREDAGDLDMSGLDMSGSDAGTIKKMMQLSKKIQHKIQEKGSKLKKMAVHIKRLQQKEKYNGELRKNMQQQIKQQEKTVMEFSDRHAKDCHSYKGKLTQMYTRINMLKQLIAKMRGAEAASAGAAGAKSSLVRGTGPTRPRARKQTSILGKSKGRRPSRRASRPAGK